MPSITYSAAKRASPRTLSGPSRRDTCAPIRPCFARSTRSGPGLGGPPPGAGGAWGGVDLERVAGGGAGVGKLDVGRLKEAGLRGRLTLQCLLGAPRPPRLRGD